VVKSFNPPTGAAGGRHVEPRAVWVYRDAVQRGALHDHTPHPLEVLPHTLQQQRGLDASVEDVPGDEVGRVDAVEAAPDGVELDGDAPLRLLMGGA